MASPERGGAERSEAEGFRKIRDAELQHKKADPLPRPNRNKGP